MYSGGASSEESRHSEGRGAGTGGSALGVKGSVPMQRKKNHTSFTSNLT